MLKYIGYIGFLFFTFSDASAQKIIEKSWDADLFNSIEIISDEVFSIKIVSETSKTIKLTATIEGEFSENIIIEARENQKNKGVLSLSTGYSPYFRIKNDKLAAHKVHAIEMEFRIPQNMDVYVQSALGTVEADGIYRNLRLELEEGSCLLTNFEGNAYLSTNNGNITVYSKNTRVSSANTTNGTFTNNLPAVGVYSLEAESVNGDITLRPSQ